MFGQSLLSGAFGGPTCTTDTDQLFPSTITTTSIATYQLNNATTSIPSNTYPGTPSNITYAAGKFGNAAVFNGSSSEISLGSSNSFSYTTTGALSINMWIKTTNTSTAYVVSKANDSSGQYEWAIEQLSNGTLSLHAYTNAGGFASTINNTAVINDGNWHNLVGVIVNNTSTTLYIDGIAATSTSFSGTAASYSIPTLIGHFGGIPAATAWFQGDVDQVRIFNTALPQSAITALYNETTTTAQSASIDYVGANPNSVAYYKMSDASDQFGNHNGTATNVNFNTEGKFGFAGAFNGSNSIIKTNLNSGNNNLTFSAWINISSNPSEAYGSIVDGRAAFYTFLAIGQNRKVWLSNDQQVSGDTGDSGYATESTTVLSIGVWYHIVGTLSSTDGAKIYINGNLDNTSVNRTSNAPAQSATSCIGSTDGSRPFNGKIDQIRIYNSVLSAANVTTLYEEIECPQATIVNSFNTVLYAGTNATQSISTVGFKPDLVWLKNRTGGNSPALVDSVRGRGDYVFSDITSIPGSQSSASQDLTSFDLNGFSLGTIFNAGSTNVSGGSIVAWNWKAGGPVVANTDGTITSSVSANKEAGFSIVKYTGNLQANASIGHGLGVKPDLIITKSFNNSESWVVWSSGLSNGNVGKQVSLNTDTLAQNGQDYYSNPDASKFYVGPYTGANGNGWTYVSYLWKSIPGYSRVGFYFGTGGSLTVYVGFEPRWVMIKRTDANGNWVIVDNKRANGDNRLYANLSNAEDAGQGESFTSTGFSPRQSSTNDTNISGGTYIYLAIA